MPACGHQERVGDDTKEQARAVPDGEINKPKGCGIGSRSALIVPVKVGSRGLRDPLEESGASHGQNRGREPREDTEPRKRVTVTSPDSHTGIANLPCEEPDALMWACPDLWGEGLGNDPSYPA